MCLGEVAQVVEVQPGSSALVRTPKRTATVSLLTLDGAVAPGEWLLCHSGFALGRLTAEEAAGATTIRTTTTTPTVPPRKDNP
jgi:hydrogenase expression/formation protein HypC